MSESKSIKHTHVDSLNIEQQSKKQNVANIPSLSDKINSLIKNRGYSEHEEANFIFVINNHKIYVTKFSIKHGLSMYASKDTSLLHTLINDCTEKILICNLPSIQNVNIELFLDYLDILIHKNFKILNNNFKTMIGLSHIFGTDIIDNLIMEEICFESNFTCENIMHFAHNDGIFKQLADKKIGKIKTEKNKLYGVKTIDIPSANDLALGPSLEAKNKAYFIHELFKILVKTS